MTDRAVTGLGGLAGDAAEEPRSPSLAVWGLGLLLATESALFGVLIASYFYLRWQGEGGWPPGDIPDPELLRPTAFTAALVVSALPLAAAQRGAARGRRPLLAGGLALAIAGGLAFLGLQVWDWAVKLEELTPQQGAYGSLVYGLTGAHVLHAAFGLALLGWVAVRSLGGAYGPGGRVGVTVAAVYWYWVVAVAVLVYLTVVLSPRW